MQYKPTFSTSRSLILVWKRQGGRLAVERRLHDPNLSRDWSVVVTTLPTRQATACWILLSSPSPKSSAELVLLLLHGLPLPVSAHADANPKNDDCFHASIATNGSWRDFRRPRHRSRARFRPLPSDTVPTCGALGPTGALQLCAHCQFLSPANLESLRVRRLWPSHVGALEKFVFAWIVTSITNFQP